MNYFNYFTEIEDTFIRRRGKHVWLSSIDWALIESWKEMGVPLHVALRGIESAFDSFEAKPRKRSVKTLMYCQEEVEAQYAEWVESQTGAQGDDANDIKGAVVNGESDAGVPFSRTAILEHLRRVRSELENLGPLTPEIDEAAARAVERLRNLEEDFASSARPDAEQLEDSLTSLEKLLDAALLARDSDPKLSAARADAASQLNSYKDRMDAATYRQTLDNLILKALREQARLPRLSLFYL